MSAQPGERIAAWLEAAIRDRGWSHRRTSLAAGLAHSIANQIITERRIPKRENFYALATALGYDGDSVLLEIGLPHLYPGTAALEEKVEADLAALTLEFRALPGVVQQPALAALRAVTEQFGRIPLAREDELADLLRLSPALYARVEQVAEELRELREGLEHNNHV
jgi:transcriptional regulator with XRE-family HTH domain